jgi:hypothetical protein
MPRGLRRRRPADRYYAFPEAALQRLEAQGDEWAFIALSHRKAVHRMATEPGCRLKHVLCLLGKNLWLHIRKDQVETDGRVKMFLEIGEETTLDTIKWHWEEIRTWQELVRTWQGPWRIGGRGYLFYTLHVRQASGESYTQLAERVNETVAKDLATYIEDERAFQEAIKAGELTDASTRLDLVEWQHKTDHSSMGLDRAKGLLWEMGLRQDEIRQWCTAALENLQRGQPAFPPGQPITRERLRDALRAWRTQNQEWLHTQEERFERLRLSEMRKALLALLEGYSRRKLPELAAARSQHGDQVLPRAVILDADVGLIQLIP